MRAEHINITIPIDLKARIDKESKLERIGRSTLIQKAVAFYLELAKRYPAGFRSLFKDFLYHIGLLKYLLKHEVFIAGLLSGFYIPFYADLFFIDLSAGGVEYLHRIPGDDNDLMIININNIFSAI